MVTRHKGLPLDAFLHASIVSYHVIFGLALLQVPCLLTHHINCFQQLYFCHSYFEEVSINILTLLQLLTNSSVPVVLWFITVSLDKENCYSPRVAFVFLATRPIIQRDSGAFLKISRKLLYSTWKNFTELGDYPDIQWGKPSFLQLWKIHVKRGYHSDPKELIQQFTTLPTNCSRQEVSPSPLWKQKNITKSQ